MSRHRDYRLDRLDEEIRRALAGLPRERAEEGFTAAVLQCLEEPHRRRSIAAGFRRGDRFGGLPARAALAGTALAAVLGLVAVGLWLHAAPPAPPRAAGGDAAVLEQAQEARALLEQLRGEHRRLERDLDSLRDFTDRDSGVIYLGGDEHLDLVLDLRRADPPSAAGMARPAVQRTGSEPPRR